uniref:DUF7083 domain-containing protein n=1 Tax=Caenorhabditis japonica TaxID=281687 RepID=A0A8R1IBP2_CAEJA
MDAQQLKLVMDMQRKANLEMMEQISRMFVQLLPTNGQPSPAAPTAESRNVSIMDSLSARLPTFTYDKENQCTFDSWYSRYEDLIEKEGNELDDASKARLVLLKLDGQSYALFTNIILPKKPADLNLEEGPILSGSRIFGSQTLWVRWIFGYQRVVGFQDDEPDADNGGDSKTTFSSFSPLSRHEILAKMAEMYKDGGYGLNQDFERAYCLFNEAAEAAMEAMNGKLANKYYEKAEMCGE